MIELYKIITCKQDSAVTLKFNTIPAPVTRGNTYKIRQDHVTFVNLAFLIESERYGIVY